MAGKSLKAIKKRITSVKNTQKITKAMKMVAAAKLRRAQHAALNARAYSIAIREVTARLLASIQDEPHPLMITKEKIQKKEFLILTSDRGLCGGFNSNLLRKIEDMLKTDQKQGIQVFCRMIGKRGRDYFKAKGLDLMEAATGLYENVDWKVAKTLAEVAMNRFENGKTDEIWIGFNYFKSTLVQEVLFQKLLPLEAATATQKKIDTIFEPSAQQVLDQILKESVIAKIYGALLESSASELAARMAAMDSATKNASEMIQYLTLIYNRARQAAITTELMDIVNGAEALQ